MQTETHHIDTPGGARIALSLHLPATPPKALLFALPGGGANRRYFDLGDATDRAFSFAHHLTTAGFAVAAADPPGVGDSSAPAAPGFYSPRAAAADLAGALDTLRKHPALTQIPVIGVGHSMGGMLVTLQHLHSRFAGVVLLGSSAGGLDWALTETERPYANNQAAVARDLEALTVARFNTPFEPMKIKPGAGAMFAGESPEATTRLRSAKDRLFNAGGMMSMIPGAFRTEAESITVPMFLGFGENDIGIPATEVHKGYPNAAGTTLVILAGTGHNHFGFSTTQHLCARLADWASHLISKDTA